MRKYILLLSFLGMMLLPRNAVAQNIIIPENDTTFMVEYRGDREMAMIARDGFLVGLVNIESASYYKLGILIQNMTADSCVFDPATVKAVVTDEQGVAHEVKSYTAKAVQTKKDIMQMLTFAATVGVGAAATLGSTVFYAIPVMGSDINIATAYNSGAVALENMDTADRMLFKSWKMLRYGMVINKGYLEKTAIQADEGIVGDLFLKKKKGKTLLVTINVNGNDYNFNWDIGKSNIVVQK